MKIFDYIKLVAIYGVGIYGSVKLGELAGEYLEEKLYEYDNKDEE